MSQAVTQLLQSGGSVAYVLVGVSFLTYLTATLRAFTLRRGFVGSVAGLLESLENDLPSPPAMQGRGLVPEFVAIGLRRLRDHGACVHDLERWAKQALDRSEQFSSFLSSLVAAAPLLGLLGTVGGMIETFASLHGTGGVALTHATEQTVAGGISVALITTQMGLMVGIPGLMMSRSLRRLEHRRRREILSALSQLRERLDRRSAPKEAVP